jgi:hypothetical protein
MYIKSIFHSYYINKYNIKLHLLTEINYDYMFRLKLAIIKSIPDTNSKYAEYNAFKYPLDLVPFFESKYRIYIFAQIL